jgi:hypothetical protein
MSETKKDKDSEVEKVPAFFVNEDDPIVAKGISTFSFNEMSAYGDAAVQLLDKALAEAREPEDKIYDRYMGQQRNDLRRNIEDEHVSDYGKEALVEFFADCANEPDVASQLSTLLGKPLTGGVTFEEVRSVVNGDGFEYKLYEAMLRKRQQMMSVRVEEEKKLIEEFHREYLVDVERLIANGTLPISLEKVRKRLALIRVAFRDHLGNITRSNKGAFEPGNRVITMNLHGTRDDKKHRYYHELVHGTLSGMVIENAPEDHIDWADVRDGYYRKFGLEFSPREKGSDKQENETWLDEAVTEDITCMLDGTSLDDGTYYPLERLDLRGYLKYGLTYEDLIAAYVEDGTGLSDAALPKWKSLSDSMDAIVQKPGVLDGWHGREKPTGFNEAKKAIVDAKRAEIDRALQTKEPESET